MDDTGEQERWETSVTTVLAVLKHQVSDMKDTLDDIAARLNNGLVARLLLVEEKVRLHEVATANVKKWMATLAATLLAALVIGIASSYLTMQSKNSQLENQLQRIERYLGQSFSPWSRQ